MVSLSSARLVCRCVLVRGCDCYEPGSPCFGRAHVAGYLVFRMAQETDLVDVRGEHFSEKMICSDTKRRLI